MPDALRAVVRDVQARVVVLSYNDESWVSLDELHEMCAARGAVEILEFDSKRYVGAQIGIHNPSGERVGTVSHVRNLEYLLIAGERREVARLARAARGADT
jgi:adenine-specific DNA-methyltransferase